VINVRFGPHCELKSDILRGPRSAKSSLISSNLVGAITRVRIPKLATGVRHAAARATAILIPPASIAIVFRPAPVGSRS
jgi:hypothetical protein